MTYPGQSLGIRPPEPNETPRARMSKTYALKRLLEHGPMTPGEIKTCTRWPGRQVEHALEELRRCGLVRMVRRADDQARGFAYEAVL